MHENTQLHIIFKRGIFSIVWREKKTEKATPFSLAMFAYSLLDMKSCSHEILDVLDQIYGFSYKFYSEFLVNFLQNSSIISKLLKYNFYSGLTRKNLQFGRRGKIYSSEAKKNFRLGGREKKLTVYGLFIFDRKIM